MLGYPIDNRCPSLKKKEVTSPFAVSSCLVATSLNVPVATEPTFIIGKNNSINDVYMCGFFSLSRSRTRRQGRERKNERLATP